MRAWKKPSLLPLDTLRVVAQRTGRRITSNNPPSLSRSLPALCKYAHHRQLERGLDLNVAIGAWEKGGGDGTGPLYTAHPPPLSGDDG